MSTRPTAIHDHTIPPGRIVRYSYSERMCHWLSGLSYLYCLISGLALFTPYLYWLAALLGGGPTARFWHPWAGLVFVIAILWMHAIWRRDMSLVAVDRQWMKSIKNYVTNRDDLLPPTRKVQRRTEAILLDHVLRSDCPADLRSGDVVP